MPNKPRNKWIPIFIGLVAMVALLIAIYLMMDRAIAALMSVV